MLLRRMRGVGRALVWCREESEGLFLVELGTVSGCFNSARMKAVRVLMLLVVQIDTSSALNLTWGWFEGF